MTYSIRQLAKLSGVSTRTLRYYEQVGLLLPYYKNDNGYRFYSTKEVDMLQQILFYKERGFELKQIKQLLQDSQFDTLRSLEAHLADLHAKKERIEAMICNLEQTIQAQKGNRIMTTKDKFQVFKEKQLAEHTLQYGAELSHHYDKSELQESHQQLANMKEKEYQQWHLLEQDILSLLTQAIQEGWAIQDNQTKGLVQRHKEWIQTVNKRYSVEKHIGIAQLYITDERFTNYYDQHHLGMAAFLEKAIRYWAPLLTER